MLRMQALASEHNGKAIIKFIFINAFTKKQRFTDEFDLETAEIIAKDLMKMVKEMRKYIKQKEKNNA